MLAPDIDIFPMIDGLAVGQRQRVEIWNLRPLRRADDLARVVLEDDPTHCMQLAGTSSLQSEQQLGERQLAFTVHDYIGPRVQILGAVVGALRTTQNDC